MNVSKVWISSNRYNTIYYPFDAISNMLGSRAGVITFCINTWCCQCALTRQRGYVFIQGECYIGAVHDTLGSFAVHPDNYFSGLLFTQVPYRGSPPDMDLFFGARYHRITMPCDPVPSRRRKDQGDFFTVTVWFTHGIRSCHDHLSGHNKEAYHGLDLVTLGTCSLASQWDSCQEWQWVSPWKCSVSPCSDTVSAVTTSGPFFWTKGSGQ